MGFSSLRGTRQMLYYQGAQSVEAASTDTESGEADASFTCLILLLLRSLKDLIIK